MPASTHLSTLLPAANENEPGWHEEVASYYELLMRSIRERPRPRPPAMSDCCLYLLHAEIHTVHMHTHFVGHSYILNRALLTPLETAHSRHTI